MGSLPDRYPWNISMKYIIFTMSLGNQNRNTNFNHMVSRKCHSKSRNEKKYIYSQNMFNVHSMRYEHAQITLWAFNNSAKSNSINCSNILSYACFHIRHSTLFFLHSHDFSGILATRSHRGLNPEIKKARLWWRFSKIPKHFKVGK